MSDFYYSWGAGAADINHDNVLDVVSGPHVFYGPDYRKRSEIYLQLTTNPSDTFATDAWMQFVSDFTGDGWGDALNCSFSAVSDARCRHPKGEPRRGTHRSCRLTRHRLLRAWTVTAAEIFTAQKGKCATRNRSRNPTGTGSSQRLVARLPDGPWLAREERYGTDRLLNPSDGVNSRPGQRRPCATIPAFAGTARDGWSVMAFYDVNGDKLNDVVTVLAAHGWGLGWFEQKRDAQGTISFERHIIMDDMSAKNAGGVTFSQPHGSSFGDVDGDGVTDFIVGKRFWSHSDSYLDPERTRRGVYGKET